MTTRLKFEARSDERRHGFWDRTGNTDTLAGERLSFAAARRLRKNPVRNQNVSPLFSFSAAVILIATLSAGGCMRQLAVKDEYFAPASGSSARSQVATQHLVSHYRALQAAQRWCAAAPRSSAGLPEETRLPAGPELGTESAHDALHNLCGSIPPPRPVAAHGAATSAHRRWVEDNVRKLPEASQTAASAAGGS